MTWEDWRLFAASLALLWLHVGCTHEQIGRAMYPSDCETRGVKVTGMACEDVEPYIDAALLMWEEKVGNCRVAGVRMYFEPRLGTPYARYQMGVIRIYDVPRWRSLIRHALAHHCAMQAGWPMAEHHARFAPLGF